MSDEMKDYIDSIEKRLNKSDIKTFHKYRFYKMAEEMESQNKLKAALCPQGHVIVVMIDDHNAITEQIKRSFQEAGYSFVLDGRKSNTYYLSVEHALLGWMGQKHNGLNSQFSQFAYRMLKPWGEV